jgi:hypothetical protein
LVPDNAIFCYICSWSRGSLHVYSLVGGLFPGSFGFGGGGLVGHLISVFFFLIPKWPHGMNLYSLPFSIV